MRLARRHEQKIARDELYALAATRELTGALRNNVHLILLVRLLRIISARRVDLDLERAVLEQRFPMATIRRGHGPCSLL